MAPHIKILALRRPGSWVVTVLFAIFACTVQAHKAASATRHQVLSYRPVFQDCRGAGGVHRLAIRRMEIDGHGMVLTVDPATLSTHLEPEKDFACTDTDDDRNADTRYIRAIHAPLPLAPPSGFLANVGLLRGTPAGSFITGDLCPSRKKLDRAFLERLEAVQSPLPLALSISGLWLIRHQADFQWLQQQQQSGALQITWVDHSYHHPYRPGRRLADNFLLMGGVDMRAEILDTEQLLIEESETPSVFFRFPGLISNPALMKLMGDYHLIVLGAGAWLAKTPRARPGDIILVHPNGNEPEGLRIFAAQLVGKKLPQPFREIDNAP